MFCKLTTKFDKDGTYSFKVTTVTIPRNRAIQDGGHSELTEAK